MVKNMCPFENANKKPNGFGLNKACFFVLVSHMQPPVALDLIWDKKSQRKKESKLCHFVTRGWVILSTFFADKIDHDSIQFGNRSYSIKTWHSWEVPKVSHFIWMTPYMCLEHGPLIVFNFKYPLKVLHPTQLDTSLKEPLRKSVSETKLCNSFCLSVQLEIILTKNNLKSNDLYFKYSTVTHR